jgi:hypothetical protein
MNDATLYINGEPIGSLKVDWPERARPAPLNFLSSLSWSGRFTYRNGKRSRRDMRRLYELELSPSARRYVRLYRAVKAHQLRKRQLNKSR